MSRATGRRLGSRTLTGVIAAGALLVGAALGTTGASLAAWNDSDSVTAGTADWGYEYFAAGVAGGALTAANAPGVATASAVNLTVDGVGLATQLLTNGKASQAFRVDSISQGNRGLRYAAAWQGSWAAGTPLANTGTTLAFFRVASAAACTPDAVPALGTGLTSEPVSAAYSTSSAVTSEFWCLTARGTMSDAGSYSNTAGATASSAAGTVTATPTGQGNTWTATVTTALTAAAQGSRTLTFTYSTFRPGA